MNPVVEISDLSVWFEGVIFAYSDSTFMFMKCLILFGFVQFYDMHYDC